MKQDGKGANECLEVNHPHCAATQSFQNGPLGLEALSDITDFNRMIQLLNLASMMSRNSKDFAVHCLKSAQISGLNYPSLKIGLYDSMLSSQKLKPYGTRVQTCNNRVGDHTHYCFGRRETELSA